MKTKILLLLIFIGLLIFSACGDDGREEEFGIQPQKSVQDSIPVLRGDFIYLADAAVLKGDDFIYGVTIDSISLDLAEKIRPHKKEDFDMIPVVVKAKISKNPGKEGWDEVIEIREVLELPEQENDSVQDPSE